MTKRILTLLVSTALCVVVLEFGLLGLDVAGVAPGLFQSLEATVPAFDREDGPGLYYAHPYSAYDMKPGDHRRGRKINALGFRGPPLAEKKAGGTHRIVAIGGSTTFGIYNHVEADTYPRLLETELRRRGRDAVEVVNAGLVSATSAETLVRFSLRILPLDPDVIVIYHGFNDVPPRLANGFRADYAHFRRVLCRKTSWLERRYLYRLAALGLGHISEDALTNRDLITYTWKLENLPDEAGMLDNFRTTSTDMFERNLESVIQIATARGIAVVLMTFAFDDDRRNWTARIPDSVWGPGIEENNEVVRSLAARHGLPLVRFAEHAAVDPSVFQDSIHLNRHGNELRARLVADAVMTLMDAQPTGN